MIVLDGLAETAVSTESGLVYWSGDDYDGYYHQKTMSSATRSTALALSAFAQIQPGSELEVVRAGFVGDAVDLHGHLVRRDSAARESL